MKFTNRYMLLYSAALVAVVALILAVVALWLKPYQQRNVAIEQQQMVLRAAGIDAPSSQVEALYAQHIREVNLLDDASMPAYLFGSQCIIPVRGTGLWGPIWGFLCFDSTWTVTGAVFDHKGETPGLGGEIATPQFAQRFIGKRVVDELGQQLVPICLKKHADPSSPYEVDAISGGTMTSNGVTQMLQEGLNHYKEFIVQ